MMLMPNRFSNLKFSLLNTTALIIEFLHNHEKVSVEDILEYIKSFYEDYTRDDIIRSITFLFALGKIEYTEDDDMVVLLNKAVKEG